MMVMRLTRAPLKHLLPPKPSLHPLPSFSFPKPKVLTLLRFSSSSSSTSSTNPPPVPVLSSNYGNYYSTATGLDPHHLSCCLPGTSPVRVAVLLSGGVDSSVALRLLHASGHLCTAFYLKIWFQEDFDNFWSECPWDEDLKYAKAVCEQVDVPLEVVHLTDEYWENVVSYIIKEYKCGRTPNPDVLCNTRIKFGAFLDAIKTMDFDYVASGHYANVVHPSAGESDKPSILGLSKDMVKDQTYFLSHLSQAQLKCLLFPLGCVTKVPSFLCNMLSIDFLLNQNNNVSEIVNLLCAHNVLQASLDTSARLVFHACFSIGRRSTYFLRFTNDACLFLNSRDIFANHLKEEVRKLATLFDLPNKDRKDSQGICFLGKIKFSEFVARHIGEMEGVILEAETGDFLGMHRGFWFHTIGQRQGLRLPGGPWYVVEKDVRNNVVFVSRNYFSLDKRRRLFRVGSLRWSTGLPPENTSQLRCKVRHGPEFYDCSLVMERGEDSSDDVAAVRLSKDDQGLAAGQFAAFYQEGTCIGSGIILESCDDDGFPVCERALERARLEDKSVLGKPVKIKTKAETTLNDPDGSELDGGLTHHPKVAISA